MGKNLLKMVQISSIVVENRHRTDLGNIKELSESIKEKGLIQPISVELGTMRLLAGGRRVAAALEAGLKEIPVLLRDTGGSELDRREVELFENIHRKDFSWQEELHSLAEIDKLYKEKFPSGSNRWTQRRTAELLGRSPATVTLGLQLSDAIEKLPELAKCKTPDEARKLLNRMVEHVVVSELRERQRNSMERGLAATLKVADANYQVGDVFKGLEELRDDGVIQLIECDPPYAIDLDELKDDERAKTYSEIPRDKYPDFLRRLCSLLYKKAGKNSWLIFWFGPTHFTLVKSSLERAGWKVRDIPGIWVKPSGQTKSPEHNLANCYEPFFLCSKGLPALVKRGRSNVFEFSPVPPQQKYHPTERPLSLMAEMLNTFVLPNAIVLVPFLGSGATLRACYLHGCLGFGWDLNPEYRDRFMLAVEQDTQKLDNEVLEEE